MGTMKIIVKNHPDLWVQINFSLIFPKFSKIRQNMCFSGEIIDFHKTRFSSILWGVNRCSERIRENHYQRWVYNAHSQQ